MLYQRFLSQLATCRFHPFTLLKSGQIVFLVQKDAQCTETCEKTVFWFLFFEKLLIFYSKYLENLRKYMAKKIVVSKDAQCFETYAKSIFRLFFFEIWSILYSKFLVNLDLDDCCLRHFANLNQRG